MAILPKSDAELAADAQLKAQIESKYNNPSLVVVDALQGKAFVAGSGPEPDAAALEAAAAVKAQITASTMGQPPAPDIAPPIPQKPPVQGEKVDATTQKLLDRIAAMESKWDADRKTWEERLAARQAEPVQPAPSQVNPREFINLNEFMLDPAGILKRYGVPYDAVAASLVAAEMGDKADPVIRARAGLSPRDIAMSQQLQTISTMNQTLLQRLNEIDERAEDEKYYRGLAEVAVKPDKDKFPECATAASRDASVLAELAREIAIDHAAANKGRKVPRLTTEQVLTSLERRFALAKTLLALPATSLQAAPADTSPKTPPANAATLGGVPSLIGSTAADDADRALREEIVRRYEGK